MASPFANAGLSQFGSESSYFDGKDSGGIGKFILGAALSSMGAPPQLTSAIIGGKAPPMNQTPAAIISSGQPADQSAQPVQPGVVMQEQNFDPQAAFSQGFKGLFSHLPTFGK